MIERDGPRAPWRFSDQPLPGLDRDRRRRGPRRRLRCARSSRSSRGSATRPPTTCPNPTPTCRRRSCRRSACPATATCCARPRAAGTTSSGPPSPAPGDDRPLKSDPVLALLLDPAGNGWAVGRLERRRRLRRSWHLGPRRRRPGDPRTRAHGGDLPLRSGSAAPPPAAGCAARADAAGPVRLAVAGHAECDAPCADLAPQSIGPDRTLSAALRAVAAMQWRERAAGAALHRQPGQDRPRPRRRGALRGTARLQRAACPSTRRSAPTTPSTASAPTPSAPPSPASRRRFGSGATPAGDLDRGHPRRGAGLRRPHPLRLRQRRAGGDGAGDRDRQLARLAGRQRSAPEPGRGRSCPGCEAVLADARARAVPAIVMGNRSLNTSFTPKLNVASDGDQVAQALVDGGASAYLFDRPEENRAMRIPAGAARDDPQLRDRHARLPLADLRRGRPADPPTRCSATAACSCSRSTPPRATRPATSPRSGCG